MQEACDIYTGEDCPDLITEDEDAEFQEARDAVNFIESCLLSSEQRPKLPKIVRYPQVYTESFVLMTVYVGNCRSTGDVPLPLEDCAGGNDRDSGRGPIEIPKSDI
jgi:hypothetical protein